MKLIDILFQELPNRGGWPFSLESAFMLRIPGITWTFRFDCYPVAILDGEIVTRSEYEAALAASKVPVWDGEGLPPVGCECEIARVADWMPVTIKFISDYHTIFKTFGGTEDCYQTCSLQFRPILTEADRKREEVTKAMKVAWRARAGEEHDGKLKSVYEIIYDAVASGKIPGIRLTDDAAE